MITANTSTTATGMATAVAMIHDIGCHLELGRVGLGHDIPPVKVVH
jgi:hypothetical protein